MNLFLYKTVRPRRNSKIQLFAKHSYSPPTKDAPEIQLGGIYMIVHMQVSKYSSSESLESLQIIVKIAALLEDEIN